MVISWVGNFGRHILCLHFRWSGWPHLQLEKTSPSQLEGPISAKPAKLDLWRNSLRIYNHGYNWTWHVAMYFGACSAACDSCRYGNVIRKHDVIRTRAICGTREISRRGLLQRNCETELNEKDVHIYPSVRKREPIISYPYTMCHHLPRCLDLLSTSSVQADTLGIAWICFCMHKVLL